MYWSFSYVYAEWGEDSTAPREAGVGGPETTAVAEEGGGPAHCRGGASTETGGAQ